MARQPYQGEAIGLLSERVELQTRTEEQDEFGQPIIVFSTLATVWGRVQPLTGVEKWTQQQVVAEQRYNVFVRHRTDLSVLDRVVWREQALEIVALANPDERRRFLQIDVKIINP